MARSKKIKIRSLAGAWVVEEVTTRMHKPCSECGKAIRNIRVKHTTDGFPYPETHIYCAPCTESKVQEAVRGIQIQVKDFLQRMSDANVGRA